MVVWRDFFRWKYICNLIFEWAGGSVVRRAGTRAVDEGDCNDRTADDVFTSGCSCSVLQPACVTGAAAEASAEHRLHNTISLHQAVAQRRRLLPRVRDSQNCIFTALLFLANNKYRMSLSKWGQGDIQTVIPVSIENSWLPCIWLRNGHWMRWHVHGYVTGIHCNTYEVTDGLGYWECLGI